MSDTNDLRQTLNSVKQNDYFLINKALMICSAILGFSFSLRVEYPNHLSPKGT